MTTNVYSGSSSHDDENSTSNEIRADINQTRASVGNKIDQLQARLDPNRLKEQAQETVQEMITDTANSMTDYVRTHKDEMISSLTTSARRNPLPTALVGLGLGWLILESLGGNKDKERDDRYEYERRYWREQNDRNRFEGSTGRSFISQGRGQISDADAYSPEYFDSPDYGRSGYPTGNVQRSEYQSTEYQSSGNQQYGNQEYGNGRQSSNPIAKAADAVKDTVGDVGQEIKERVGDVGHEIKERVGNMAQDMKEGARERMDDMRRQAGSMGEQTQHSMYRAGDRVGDRMDEWQQRARYEGQRRGQQVMRNLEDNPLTYGALALAAGAALALLLPQTRTENRAFGEMRDQVVDRGQDVMRTAKSHVQEVVEEVRPEFEQKARQLVEDVKETGKQVAKDAANEMRPVVDKAIEKGKEGARDTAKDAGVDPDKMTGDKGNQSGQSSGQSGQSGKPALNRDTLAGQWKQVKGEVKSKWGQLTDDELTKMEGDYDKLVGAIQTRYGYTRERSEREINDFFNSRKS